MTSKQQFILCILGFITAVVLIGVVAFVEISKYDKEVEINAQAEIEKTKIEAEKDIERTKERMNWVPWYNGDKNEK